MNNYILMPLQWDTKYFNVVSAKLTLTDTIEQNTLKLILEKCNEFEFVTIMNKNNLSTNNILIGRNTNAFLVDINVQFEKDVINRGFNNSNIQISNYFKKNNEILKIANQEFIHSRFTNDPYLPKELSTKVYYHWTDSSFDKEDKFFVTYDLQNKIVGYIIFNINDVESIATIELIAINNMFQNIGIGNQLIEYLEQFLFDNKVNYLRVGTQLDNISAVNFYKKIGFTYKSCSSIYHYWNSLQ